MRSGRSFLWRSAETFSNRENHLNVTPSTLHQIRTDAEAAHAVVWSRTRKMCSTMEVRGS